MPHNRQIRAVTHYGVERSDVEATVRAVREALDETPYLAPRETGAPAAAGVA
jgi:hypothetical protein